MTEALTDEEQVLLSRYLDFYDALARGDRRPETEAQEHFVQVAQGKAGAETVHELAYAKFMRQRALEREVSRLECEERRAAETTAPSGSAARTTGSRGDASTQITCGGETTPDRASNRSVSVVGHLGC